MLPEAVEEIAMKSTDVSVPIDPLHDVLLEDGIFSDTTADQLSQAFVHAAESPHLSVFFHGGLISEADGLKTASQLIDDYTNIGHT